MRTALSAVLDKRECDPQNWLSHTLCSHPVYRTTVIEQLAGEYFEGKFTQAGFQGLSQVSQSLRQLWQLQAIKQ